ncbi:cysteine hydrolase family protein [Nocardia miyunensis]|uniref:cysteine hydrolase family protein n=1 Tax=Nocardia miyunensis TaxID=282684 RepID=UPI000829F16F|nr:isochorismatase family cysteine hydrolase [Nocardia miyunensis]
MKQSALVVIDMQEFFFVENTELDRGELGQRCHEIVDIARQAGIPVIYVVTLYREDRVDWPKAWQAGDTWCGNLVRGVEQAQVIDQLSIKPDDFIVEKKRFSGFYNTNLDDILRSLDCDHIYVIGYSADVCLRFTSVDAYNRGYRVSLVYEGIESFRESKDASVAYLDWLIDAECVRLTEFRTRALDDQPAI